MYTVASPDADPDPDPDPNPRGGGQLPNPSECNSTLTSGTRGIYPHHYILMLMSWVTMGSPLMFFPCAVTHADGL